MIKKKFDKGGILGGKLEGSRPVCGNPGKILTSQSQYNYLGGNAIRGIYGDRNAQIIVVPDEKLKTLSASEKMALLLN